MQLPRHSAWLVLWLCCCCVPAVANETESDELLPGLVGRYTVGERSIERIDPDVQFAWDGVPDERLPAGPMTVHWKGQVLIPGGEGYRFHLYLHGAARVVLGGRVILDDRRNLPGWVSTKEVSLEAGEIPVEIEYRQTIPVGAIRLFWSSESFLLEPVPARGLLHSGTRPDLERLARGRELYAAHRCQRCHLRGNEEPVPDAAPLAWAASGLSRDWLTQWLLDPRKMQRHARMPIFGFSETEAQSIAEFLASQAKPFVVKGVEHTDRAAARRRGEVLFRSVGCLACHTHGELGTDTPLAGGDLTAIGRKRSESWLEAWLQSPEKLNPVHRMPAFRLANEECRDLAAYLAGGEVPVVDESPSASHDAMISSGKKLVESRRCIACHSDPQVVPDLGDIPRLGEPVVEWARACSEAPAADSSTGRPVYALSQDDRAAVREFVESRYRKLTKLDRATAGLQELRRQNCLNCHERDGGRGIAPLAGKLAALDPDLVGQSEALLPPDLSSVGDKLRDDYLTSAIGGAQDKFRLPWLRVRMPRFHQTRFDASAIQQYLVTHDRIPEGAPLHRESLVQAAAKPVKAREQRDVGRLLAGTRGFSCVACHKIGSYEPRNVALATHGSDLYRLATRMRPAFFARWMRSPLRIVPNMEMPAFDRPLPGVLEGEIDAQHAALWAALNDPKGPPKLDTSTIEQVLVAEAGSPAKIVRDVFRIGSSVESKFVPRALAVGFGNGQNALFDLDSLSLVHVWSGDFARQRSAGKSWFWEAAVDTSISTAKRLPDLSLRPENQVDKFYVPLRENGRYGKLLRYSRDGQGLRFEYRMTFDLPAGRSIVDVTETWQPLPTDETRSRAGWTRKIELAGVPAGLVPGLRRSSWEAERFTSNSEAIDELFSELPGGKRRQIASVRFVSPVDVPRQLAAVPQPPSLSADPVRSVPGYDGIRLPLPWSIMPSALCWRPDGTLAFCSLKGHIYLAKDTNGDGLEDALTVFEEGLAAPYGLIADGNDLIVAHKPELLRLRDTDGDGRADVREVLADGWGYTDDYHDWTTGIVRDSSGNLYIGTGSDYAKPGREAELANWRGKVLRVEPNGSVTALGHAFRYPTGLAITPDDQVFVTDNQGVQNTFNEINHLVAGAQYGVPSLHEELHEGAASPPAIQVPHPWTRSVNGIFFLPNGARTQNPAGPFAGHGIGCEYDSRFLMRFTLQRVGDTYQGAAYPFSRPPGKETAGQFLGTLCGGTAPNGDIYIGSIYDSGWLGGPNVGELVRLRRSGELPCGIRQIRAAAGEFEITFTSPVDREGASRPEHYDISGYTRVWQGAYATPDSNRHKLAVQQATVSRDGLSVRLQVEGQQAGHVYEINCGRLASSAKTSLWPAVGYYTLNAIPDK